ncbi:MAG TPA: 4-alpha-glucanotransferase [Bryobacteraceae bacterium]|nr:4-alpha-glucanotransferase [Bryobacteraceae bacterium]
MRFPRSSGILLHPTSLPGPFGIGDLGSQARRFVDFLAAAGQTLWQVLPLGPTGFADSPYQCFSALAGNPLLISPERLAEQGWLDQAALAGAPEFSESRVDYERVIPWKTALLESAARGFLRSASPSDRAEFQSFCDLNQDWLDDFALFMVLKQRHGYAVWSQWEPAIRWRDPAALAAFQEKLSEPIAIQKFLQFAFFAEWRELRDYAHARGVRLMGDLPIYVAHDSADVWVNPQYFELDSEGNAAVVAGVPPDYFSATGQLWGNPIYRWRAIEGDGYRWWLRRFRAVLALVDMIRLDHFRGFEAYWEVPAGETTAIHGRWAKGPGAGLFRVAHDALGELPLVAENLGVITPEVEAIRHEFGFPGMTILQFAFGSDPQAPSFRPHNYPREVVAYTGTHDCDTTVGWWTSEGRGESTRSAEDIRRERAFVRAYLNTDGSQIHWVFIRTLLSSVADTVLIPLQDVLGLGSEARMNQPATIGGNWRWRYQPEMLTAEIAERLAKLARVYER